MSTEDFIEYIAKTCPKHYGKTWENFFLPQINRIVKKVLRQSADQMESRPQSFELFGFDFAIDKDLNLWLIEVNMSPACAERQPWLTVMLDDMDTGLTQVIGAKVQGLPDVLSYAGGTGWIPMSHDDHFYVKLDGKKTKVKIPSQKSESIATQGNLDIFGRSLNLKVENFIDRMCQRVSAVQFI